MVMYYIAEFCNINTHMYMSHFLNIMVTHVIQFFTPYSFRYFTTGSRQIGTL